MFQSLNIVMPVENPLFALAIILSIGTILGKLAKKIHLPSVTGHILAGLLISKSCFNLINVKIVDQNISIITDFALGLIAVTVGNHLNFKKLRNAFKRIFAIAIIEALVVPLVIAAALMLAGLDLIFVILISTISISTSPASIVSIINETKSKGTFVKTLVSVVALNNVTCILLFETARNFSVAFLEGGQILNVVDLTSQILLLTVKNALLGCIVGALLLFFSRENFIKAKQFTATLAAILLICGLAAVLSLSPLLSALFMGIFLANATPYQDKILDVFDELEEALFALFFTIAGTHIDLSLMKKAGLICTLYILARMSGKYMAIYLASRHTHTINSIKKYLGLALVPQAGISIGLIIILENTPALAKFSGLITTIILPAVIINEIIGPILTRLSLIKSGEINKNRPRLIDFLHEENIFFNVPGDTKEEVLENLCNFFWSSAHIHGISKKEMLKSYLKREEEFSTCVGHGVMIPHIRIPQGDQIIGAVGVMATPLKIETYDEKPVSFIVMMATPEGKADIHLEVLATISKLFMNTFLEEKISQAKSPARLIEILHGEEYEDLNYFLES